MTQVIITQNDLGETDTDKINFPALTLRQAIQSFTKAAYGQALTFEHA